MEMNQNSMQPELDYQKLDRMLDRVKGQLFLKKNAGFLGSLLCNHELAWDLECDTAWCNGHTIAFNPHFFLKLNQETRISVLAHELWHTGFDHMGRRGNKDPELWNIAADYVINNQLDHDGFIFEGVSPCLDDAYDGMTTEEIYAALVEECDLGGSPTPGDLAGDVREGPEGADEGSNSQDKGTSSTNVKAKIVAAKQAAQMAKEVGNLPGEITQIIENYLNPILPWEQLLYRYFSDMDQDDFSWRRPSRRYEDEYLPSLYSDDKLEHLMYFVDVSGSVTDLELERFFSEVRFIHTQFTPKRLTVLTFDTEIQDRYEFSDDDTFSRVEIHGRGGTSLDPVRKVIKEERPTASVVFSDLYCQPMHENPGSPLLWVIMDNPRAKTFFGTRIHISRDHYTGTEETS